MCANKGMQKSSIIECINEARRSVRYMKYTTEYSDDAKAAESGTGLLTAESHSKMSEIDFFDVFQSKERLISWYFSYLGNERKLDAVGEVASYIKCNRCRRVVSFGAGHAVLEYMLSVMYPNCHIIATDYDEYIVKGANSILNSDNFEVQRFDFYNSNLDDVINETDLVLFFGSTCSMETKQYQLFLSELYRKNVKAVFTFEAGVSTTYELLRDLVMPVLVSIKRFMFGEKMQIHNGAIHAYRRTQSEVQHIIRKSGYSCKRIIGLKPYRYAYLLER